MGAELAGVSHAAISIARITAVHSADEISKFFFTLLLLFVYYTIGFLRIVKGAH
jgi:hypothetical protein